MFLHTAKWGQKEAECMVCQGSTREPDPEVGQSTMELVGYWTSLKEIWDIYQSVYLLWRPPGFPSCGDQLRRKMIQDILSSLEDQLHRCGYSAAARGDPEPREGWQSRSDRQESYEEALRVAHQRALDTAEALQGDIERQSQRARDRSQICTRTHSQTHSQSCSRSHFRSRSRSCSRAHSQSHPWSSSPSRQPRSPNGPPPGRRVMFREPEVRLNFKGSVEDYLLEALFQMWRYGYSGKPNNWALQHGGQSSRPSREWRIQECSLVRFRPLSISLKLRYGLFGTRIYCTSCPQVPQQKCLPSGWIVIPRHTATTDSPNDCLHKRPTILGRKT